MYRELLSQTCDIIRYEVLPPISSPRAAALQVVAKMVHNRMTLSSLEIDSVDHILVLPTCDRESCADLLENSSQRFQLGNEVLVTRCGSAATEKIDR